MTTTATAERYSGTTIFLHWLILVLIVTSYASMELKDFFPKGSDVREGMKYWHFSVGLSILALVVVRIAARLAGPAPPIVPAPPAYVASAAKAGHIALYALMVMMPIGGWLILSGEGKAIPLWGLELPPLIGEDKDFAGLIEDLHEIGAKIGYLLIAIHAAAALYHHHVVKDNTLRRMLPGR